MERLFGAIPEALGGLGKNREIEEALVFAAWNAQAGAEIRKRCIPLEFFEKKLVVGVADETWRLHLEALAPQMIARLNSFLGQNSVRFIELRLDRSLAKGKEQTDRQAAASGTYEVPLSIARAAEAISDERLREQFLSAAASYLSSQEK